MIWNPIGKNGESTLTDASIVVSKSRTDRQSHHRGLPDIPGEFAQRFLEARLAGFEKDIAICLTGIPSKTRRGATHAYFPALSSCCGTLEYLAGLYKGNLDNVGWRDVAEWCEHYMVKVEYNDDVVRVFFEAFRNSIAHRGIASGVWIDRKKGSARRFTWNVHADARRPAIQFVEMPGVLVKDPPWPCPYTHRANFHLRALAIDIREGARAYVKQVGEEKSLTDKFMKCMKELYPKQ